MPLQSDLPVLDDRRYKDIVNELRTRVPRYTPEWTDLNDNDPGMALAQLFAWLADMLLYRLGRVPEQNYIKFLELLGIERQPAAPALAEITFPVLPDSPQSTVIVPMRTQVSAPADDGGSPVIFETDKALVAIRSRLLSVQSDSGFDFRDLSAANQTNSQLPGADGDALAQTSVPTTDQGFLPFGELADAGAALMLGFDSAQPLPEVNLDLAFYLVNQPGEKSSYSCDLPETAFFPPAVLVWEYWVGTYWTALTRAKDDTRSLTRSGHMVLKLPPKGKMQPATLGQVAEPRYWIRVRIASGGYEKPPILFAVVTNTISATQAETRYDEVLGGSDGEPNQKFTLQNAPVLAGTLQLEVDEGDGFKVWKEVSDFYGSGRDSTHYALNRTTGEVSFGDGLHGRIPVGNVNNADNIVARTYRYGGGKRGNAPSGAIKTLASSIPGIDEAAVGNLWAATSGRDEEALEEAKGRARGTLKSKCRAVTSEDFETLAREAANVKRALTMPLAHPDFPGVQVPGVITVVVVPDADENDPAPIPSEGTLRTVCAYLNQRRLLTTEVYVAKPTYKQVSVMVELVANDNADLAEVRDGVEKDLLKYFHPLTGGDTGEGWPFGGDIFYSRVYSRIFTQEGVQRIERLVVTVDGVEAPECRDVEIPEGALLYSTAHDVRPSYEYE
ncbi:MAG TPA: putative baseplate assembly protein [Chloroflexia bacterium]|nr:putative baseplate assembly protein [Chloroflexia bacterium]